MHLWPLPLREWGNNKKESLETEQTTCILARLEALEMCLKEVEEKAKALSKQLSVSKAMQTNLLEQVPGWRKTRGSGRQEAQ
ncbi:hypothetical protein HJG60_002217 [Phyllostomus discolor]|uniref:Uncharacterized protein n=1 Tax=Phyllostomus discolor TaxID=89673 RepID=A0A834B518_9CHIR|nr:hypothetical protein HJG60_002217 [Phyllostomus discolor]